MIISVWSQLMYQVMVGQCSDDRQSSKIQLKSSTFSGQNWSCSASYNCLKLQEILKNLIGNRVVVPVWKFILPAPLKIREKITFSLPMVNRILTNHWAMDKPIYWPTISYNQPQLHTLNPKKLLQWTANYVNWTLYLDGWANQQRKHQLCPRVYCLDHFALWKLL